MQSEASKWLGKYPAGCEDKAGPRGVHRNIIDGIPMPLCRLHPKPMDYNMRAGVPTPALCARCIASQRDRSPCMDRIGAYPVQ